MEIFVFFFLLFGCTFYVLSVEWCEVHYIQYFSFLISVMMLSGVNPGEQWEDNLIRAEVQQSTTTQLDKR